MAEHEEADQPEQRQQYFTCPHCRTLAHMPEIPLFVRTYMQGSQSGRETYTKNGHVGIRACIRCHKHIIWYQQQLIYPLGSTVDPPHPDLPEHVVKDVQEAKDIMSQSPRAACSLLRLALEKLCRQITGTDKKLSDQIGILSTNHHLNPVIVKALDVVRVVGNDKVHPGSLDDRDDLQDAQVLYSMIHNIVEELISRPRLYDEQYNRLPQAKRDEIERRNDRLRGN